MEDKKEDTKSLGIGKIFLGSIQNLLQQSDYCRKMGDYSGWRSNQDCVVAKFSGRTTPEEDNKILNHIVDLNDLSLAYAIRCMKDKKKSPHKQTIIVKKKYANALSEYQKTVIKILDRLDWLIPNERRERRPQ